MCIRDSRMICQLFVKSRINSHIELPFKRFLRLTAKALTSLKIFVHCFMKFLIPEIIQYFFSS